MEIEDIVRNAGMNPYPSYFSGRGAIYGDLNHKILEGIFEGILEHFGEQAAYNYVRMVADIKILSAACFLNTLYQLCANNWKMKVVSSGISDHIDLTNEHSMFATGFEITSGSMTRNDTGVIRDQFLYEHGIESKFMRMNREQYQFRDVGCYEYYDEETKKIHMRYV